MNKNLKRALSLYISVIFFVFLLLSCSIETKPNKENDITNNESNLESSYNEESSSEMVVENSENSIVVKEESMAESEIIVEESSEEMIEESIIEEEVIIEESESEEVQEEVFEESEVYVPQESNYPIEYSDATSNITITKEWYEDAYVYAAHITFSDYQRFGTTCGGGYYGGYETTSQAASRVGAILAINGCYSAPYLEYPVARSGVVYNDKACYVPAVYSNTSGMFMSAWEVGGVSGIVGAQLSTLVNDGTVSDTFSFGAPFLSGGTITIGGDTSRAQRTFIGTNGNAGDIWLVVSDGRYNDGESSGLTYKQCAEYLQSKGCVFGIPLDGGGSSTMVWQGEVLNAAYDERYVVDFVYFKY